MQQQIKKRLKGQSDDDSDQISDIFDEKEAYNKKAG